MMSPVALAPGRGLVRSGVSGRLCQFGLVFRGGFVRAAFTLIEVLIATAIAMLLMAAVVTLFASVSERMSRTQAMMETVDRLRGAQHRLQTDLRNHTAPLQARLDPREGKGFFEIVEGPGPFFLTGQGIQPLNTDNSGLDTTHGDIDDFFGWTTRSFGEPFVGRGGNVATTIQSHVAEVWWFVRGTTLYRRVLLVVPERTVPTATYAGMYYFSDASVHQEGGNAEPNANWGAARLVTNSLGDLTKRENRYAHVPRYAGHAREGYPHDVRMWGQLGLPTLRESSDPNWPLPYFGTTPTFPTVAGVANNDFWITPHPWAVDQETGAMGGYVGNRNPERIAEDVILTNVLSFDIKVWDPTAPVFASAGSPAVALHPGDPGYRAALQAGNTPVSRGAYVDLYYARGIGSATNASMFSGPGNPRSQLHAATVADAAIWDSHATPWYESNGVDEDNDGIVDNANDGLDNNDSSGVDDATEQETAPPYEAPIRSIQIKIRVFEPDTRQIREVTVTQDFVP